MRALRGRADRAYGWLDRRRRTLLRAGHARGQAACNFLESQRRGPSLARRLACGLAHRREGPAGPGGPEAKTHCSAFVAAMAERLGIYVLRPPQHSQRLLANAQMRWLRDHGRSSPDGRRLGSDAEAQEAANRGELVVEAYENPDRAQARPYRDRASE